MRLKKEALRREFVPGKVEEVMLKRRKDWNRSCLVGRSTLK